MSKNGIGKKYEPQEILNAVYDAANAALKVSGGAAATTFIGLTDVPVAYTGSALKVVRVNAGADALEFSTAGTGDLVAANNLSDIVTPATALTNIGGIGAATTDTLTNKTLTSPKVGTAILDTNGAELLKVTATGTAVNELTLANAATGNAPTVTASGDDTDISINLVPKGAGTIQAGGAAVVTAASTATFTNKTFDANGTGNSLSHVDVADLSDGTDGNLITWDADGHPAVVATGDAGQVLTSNGAGAAPTFQAAGGFAWGASITSTTGSGVTVTVANSSDTGTNGINGVAGDTQSNYINVIKASVGTSGKANGVLIQGTGGTRTDGTGVHLCLWGDTAGNANNVFTIGNGTSYTERFFILADGKVSINPSTNSSTQSALAVTATGMIGGGIGISLANTQTASHAMTRMFQSVYGMTHNSFSNLDNTNGINRFYFDRTNSKTSGNLADSYAVINVNTICGQTGAGGTTTYTGAVMLLNHTCTNSAGTLADSSHALRITHNTLLASTRTWAVSITHDNAGASGVPCGIDMSSFSVDEPVMKFVEDAVTVVGGMISQVAIDVGGATRYFYTYGHSATASAYDYAFDTTTGTKLGTGATQKIGFWNATPVVQPSHLVDVKTDYTTGDLDTEAEVISAINTTNTRINDILAQLATTGLQAAS